MLLSGSNSSNPELQVYVALDPLKLRAAAITRPFAGDCNSGH